MQHTDKTERDFRNSQQIKNQQISKPRMTSKDSFEQIRPGWVNKGLQTWGLYDDNYHHHRREIASWDSISWTVATRKNCAGDSDGSLRAKLS